MRGGAWPLLLFGTFMIVMGTANRVWTGSTIQSGTFAFAAFVAYAAVAGLLLRGRREPLRRGAPLPSSEVRAVPAASLGAAVMAVGAAGIVFGFVFALFLGAIGCGLLVAGAGLLAREIAAERRALRAYRRGELR